MLKQINSVGVAFRGSLGSVDPLPPPPTSGDEVVASFGALTLPGAGGFKPQESGTLTPIDLVTITDQSAATRTWSISNGALVADGTPDVDDGVVLTVEDGASNSYEVTITAEADAWSVANVADMQAIATIPAATKAGKVMRIRPGTYDIAQTSDWLEVANYASPFTIASHDAPAYTGNVTDTFHDRVKLRWADGNNDTKIGGTQNVVFDGFCIEGLYDRRVDGPTAYPIRWNAGVTRNLTFRNMWLKGNTEDLGPGPNFRGLMGGDGNSDVEGVTISQCRFSNTGRGMNTMPSNSVLEDSSITSYSSDGMFLGVDNIVRRNFFGGVGSDNTDVTFKSGTGVRSAYDAPITGVADSATGLIFLRFRPSAITGSTQTIFSADISSTDESVLVEITSLGKVRLFASNTSNINVFDVESALSVEPNCQHCLLISLDSGAIINAHLSIEGGSDTRPTTTELISQSRQTATGLPIEWNTARGMSLGGKFDSFAPAPGRDPYSGAISRVAVWPGVSADVTSSAVRDLFFDASQNHLPYILDGGAASYGVPPVDISGQLSEWRGASGLNRGSGENFVKTTAASQDLDTNHIDVAQGALNTGVNVKASTSVSGVGYEFHDNVFVAVFDDGSIDSSGESQGLFVEDAQSMGQWDGAIVERNIFVGGGPHGISWYNQANSRMIHNVTLTPEEFRDGGGNNYSIAALVHGTYNVGAVVNIDGKTGTIVEGDQMTKGGATVDAIVYEVIAQTAFTAQLRLITDVDQNGVQDSNSPREIADQYADNDAVTFIGSGATGNLNGDPSYVTPPGLEGMSSVIAGNIVSGGTTYGNTVVSDPNGTGTGDVTHQVSDGRNDAYRSEVDRQNLNGANTPELQGILDSEMSTYFTGNAGDYDLSFLQDWSSARSYFAAQPSLRTGRQIQYGWDAYPYGQSPIIVTASAFSVPDLSDQSVGVLVESAPVQITGVSANGCGVLAKDASDNADVEIQILGNDGTTVIEDWTTEYCFINNNEHIKVRYTTSGATSDTVDVVVIAGDQSDTWSITTAAPAFAIDDQLITDSAGEWTTNGSLAYNAVEDGIEFTDTSSFRDHWRDYVNADSEVTSIVSGQSYRCRVEFEWVSGGLTLSTYGGNTASARANQYWNDTRVGAGGGVLSFEETFTATTDGIFTLTLTGRGGGTGTNVLRLLSVTLEEA